MKSRYVIFLIIFYGIYLIIGASVFQALEYKREKLMCEETLEDLKQFNISAESKFIGNALQLVNVSNVRYHNLNKIK